MRHISDRPDPDLSKGAVEDVVGIHAHGNMNAPAIDENGWPNDDVAVTEDVVGANEDETQG